MGAPKKTIKKVTQVSVRFEEAELRELLKEAAAQKRTLAGYVRYLVDMARQKKK
jgi:hypothetical protein